MGCMSPEQIRTTVVLPDPLLPSSAVTPPSAIANEMPNSDRKGP